MITRLSMCFCCDLFSTLHTYMCNIVCVSTCNVFAPTFLQLIIWVWYSWALLWYSDLHSTSFIFIGDSSENIGNTRKKCKAHWLTFSNFRRMTAETDNESCVYKRKSPNYKWLHSWVKSFRLCQEEVIFIVKSPENTLSECVSSGACMRVCFVFCVCVWEESQYVASFECTLWKSYFHDNVKNSSQSACDLHTPLTEKTDRGQCQAG